jgi:hypothetical protein
VIAVRRTLTSAMIVSRTGSASVLAIAVIS